MAIAMNLTLDSLFSFPAKFRRKSRRTMEVSKDLSQIKIKLPIYNKTKNYLRNIFSRPTKLSTDHNYMIQLMVVIGEDNLVWLKCGEVIQKRVGGATVFAEFDISDDLLLDIRFDLLNKSDLDIKLAASIIDQDPQVSSIDEKVVYINSKEFHKMRKEAQVRNLKSA